MQNMNITSFADLLDAARRQSEPQRLLLVFAQASLPAHASAQQRADFEAGRGGELAPLMCVDKDPAELHDFEALVSEARSLDDRWVLVFAAALDGHAGQPPSPEKVGAALEQMVEAVRTGHLEAFIPFDREGQAVHLG